MLTGEFSNITSALECLITERESETSKACPEPCRREERGKIDCPLSTSSSAWLISTPSKFTAHPCRPVEMPVNEKVMSYCDLSKPCLRNKSRARAQATFPNPIRARL